MAIRVVRLGTPRVPAEGIRLGTVRRPPRGIKRSEYARRNYFDVWVPDLAPSAGLLAWARSKPLTATRWNSFTRRYRAEMARPPAQHWISVLAALSAEADFSIGCFCEDELRCHRSVLRELLRHAGATLA